MNVFVAYILTDEEAHTHTKTPRESSAQSPDLFPS